MPIARDRVEQLQVQKLIYAVRVEDYEQVKKLCEKGVEYLVNYNDPQCGLTALIAAVTENNEKMIQYLIQLGAHPDVIDFKGRTAMMHAVEYGHVNALQLLKDAKADPKIQDLEGKDALYYCFTEPTNRHKLCLKLVLEMGGEVNNRSRDGLPNLVYVCSESVEKEEFCLNLIQHGADVKLVDEKTKRTALHNACLSGNANVVRALLRNKADVNALDNKLSSPAHEAAKGGHLEVIQVLSGFGAKFDVYDTLGNNPIHYAAGSNAGNAVRFLGQRGCNPKAKNLEGLIPKKIADQNKAKDAKKNMRKAEKFYNDTNANLRPEMNEYRDWKLLLYDYVYEHKERIEKLFDEIDEAKTGLITSDHFKKFLEDDGLLTLFKPDDIKDIIEKHEKERNEFDYKTFLTGKKYITKPYLMSSFEGKKKKKKKAKKGKKQKSVLPIAIQDEGPRTNGGNPPLIYQPQHIHYTDNTRFSRDNPPKHALQDDSPWYLDKPDMAYVNLCDAAYRGDLQTLLDAYKHGVPVDITDKFMKTPLMVACSHGDLKTVQFLLTCGADINLTDNFKWTALHHAAHSGQIDVVKAIVDAGGQINAESVTKATPLMRAIESLDPLTVAAEFADPRIYHLLNERVNSMPKPKSATQKKSTSASKKRPQTTGKAKSDAVCISRDKYVLTTRDIYIWYFFQHSAGTVQTTQRTQPRRGSLLRAAAELAKSFDNTESITFHPKTKWTEQPSTQDMIREKGILRERFGWEVDFHDFKMPFMDNASKRLEKMTLPDIKI
ncbi:unnamed protein product [Didymodactylos carnosus]|uniref:EF-hand domain-containing protein n=2 Tax=Didymodactylos carnosus TaxID=1234261 RepID=A0A8S2J412_9BILA|nr:unnamed protein product [Didymodactylos carnosus]CAF3792426.1 unnamed protein product [Didymodactylos carnosus]